MTLQYFHFKEPRSVTVQTPGVGRGYRNAVALGYWQDLDDGPGGATRYNLSDGVEGDTDWFVFIQNVVKL